MSSSNLNSFSNSTSSRGILPTNAILRDGTMASLNLDSVPTLCIIATAELQINVQRLHRASRSPRERHTPSHLDPLQKESWKCTSRVQSHIGFCKAASLLQPWLHLGKLENRQTEEKEMEFFQRTARSHGISTSPMPSLRTSRCKRLQGQKQVHQQNAEIHASETDTAQIHRGSFISL